MTWRPPIWPCGRIGYSVNPLRTFSEQSVESDEVLRVVLDVDDDRIDAREVVHGPAVPLRWTIWPRFQLSIATVLILREVTLMVSTVPVWTAVPLVLWRRRACTG